MAKKPQTSGEWAGSSGDRQDDSVEQHDSSVNDVTTEAKKPKKTLEEKRADFSRLASSRVSRAIDALSALNHLASTQSYAWDVEMRDKIFHAIREKMDNVEQSFIAAETPTDGRKNTSKRLSFRV